MVITLEDIRNAANSYVNTKVTRQITITPKGDTINVSEDFSIRISVTNPAPAQGGIELKNVRYHVRIPDINIAGLQKPTAAVGVAKNGPDPTSTLIPGSSFPVLNMWIHPASDD